MPAAIDPTTVGDVIAIDIGGTKMEVARADPDGRLVGRRRAPTRGVDAEALWEVLVELLAGLDADGVVGIGVGVGGPMSPGGEMISPLNITEWRDFPLRARLAHRFQLPVTVENDAKALALAEGWLGSARGVTNYLAMVVSTGVGGGIVLDGRLLDGSSGNAGHIGHVIVAPEGHELPDHVQGVLEGEISGTAFQHKHGRSATEATAAEIDESGRLLGQAVGSVANLLDLRLAVVAGSVALGFGDPFFAAAQRELDRVAQLDHSRGARIEPAGLGDEGPLVGAAAVGYRGLGGDPLAWGADVR